MISIVQPKPLDTRSVPEWIGKTPDSVPPPRVKLRVLLRYDGRDYLTGVKIRPGDDVEMEHVIAIVNGGENRERNLAPVIKGKAHKEKTARDVAEKSKVADQAKSHLGLKPKKRRIRSAGFQRDRDRDTKLAQRREAREELAILSGQKASRPLERRT